VGGAVPERSLAGIQIGELPNAEQPIARGCTQTAAFVGRTLRGPLDWPIVVTSFSEFQRAFGGLWQPSPLSYAVEQFFDQGGRRAVIVRVANGAASVTLSLRCGPEALRLEARAPGTREFLRASVDYDHVPAEDAQSFNLVVQRVRAPGSERIEEQETFRALSVDPMSPRFVATALLESALVRVRGPVPQLRPERTLMAGTNLPVGYVSSNPDGHDGRPITDYDLIGSQSRCTGLFALNAVEDLSFVYLPPLARNVDIGVSTLLVADRFCHERRAILIVDPPASWTTPAEAIDGLRDLSFRSDNAVMFFPRIIAMDRLRGRSEVFGNGGAVAGVLSRIDESAPGCVPGMIESDPVLRASARLAREIDQSDRAKLVKHGINVLLGVRSAERHRAQLRTLAGGANAAADWAYLGARRFALYVLDAIVRGTQWAVLSPATVETWRRVEGQASDFLQGLHADGAFSGIPVEQSFSVICDERINDEASGELHILVRFVAIHPGEHHCFMITHGAHGSTVRPVAMNRLEGAMGPLEGEPETGRSHVPILTFRA
jgi:hypothetical protein